MQLHFPQNIVGWSVFVFGLILVSYRIHGIDAPRTWIEWVERRFTYGIVLRFIGAIMMIAAALAWYFSTPQGLLGILFVAAMSILIVVGFGLLILQNHTRSLVFATAESTDNMIRISSIIIIIIGLCFMIAPFLF